MKRLPTEFRAAIVVAIAVCTLGSLLWLNGNAYMGDGYFFGDKVYKLGWPLTEIVFAFAKHHGPLQKVDDAWAIPTMDLLLTLQMLSWAFLVTLIRRLGSTDKKASGA
jgi:hypothetical protein